MESNYMGLGGGNATTKVHIAPEKDVEENKAIQKVIRDQANIILVNALADLVLYHKPKAIALLKRHNIKTKKLKGSITLGLTTGLVSGNKAFTDDLHKTLEEIGSLPKDSEQSKLVDVASDVASSSGGTPWGPIIATVGAAITGVVTKGMDKARAKLQGAKAYQMEVLKTMQEKIKAGGSNKRAIIWSVAIVTAVIIATVGYVITKKT